MKEAIVIFCDVVLVICGCVLIYSVWQLFRNHKVSKFRGQIIELCYEYEMRLMPNPFFEPSPYTWFYDKYSYEDMMNSTKPLILEKWYSQEEINKLLGRK